MARDLQHGRWDARRCRHLSAAMIGLGTILSIFFLTPAARAASQSALRPALSVVGETSLIPGWGPSGGAVLATYSEQTNTRSGRSAPLRATRFVVRNSRQQRVRTLRPILLPQQKVRSLSQTRSVTWDGRTEAGDDAPAGTYRIVALTRAGETLATTRVTVKATPLRISGLKLSTGGLGRSANRRQVRARFGLTQTSSVVAAVVDRNGLVVKQLVGGRVRKGRPSLKWNGRTSGGVQAADGMYEIVVVAQGSGAPTTTVRAPIRVDVSAPTMSTPEQVAARLGAGTATFVISLSASEPGTIRITTDNRKSVTRQIRASGANQVTLRASELGLSPTTSARNVGAQITLTDSVGNTVTNRLRLSVPAVAAPNPGGGSTAPPPTAPVGTSGMRWPSSGPLTSTFGPRWGRMHQGIDIGSPHGAPIIAAKDGSVTFSGSQNGYGNTIVVDHGGGVTTLYAHQSKLNAVVGQRVARGQVIGYVGSTGKSSGPHLHFEIRINGTAVNPLPYLPGTRQLILGAEADHDHNQDGLNGAEASAI